MILHLATLLLHQAMVPGPSLYGWVPATQYNSNVSMTGNVLVDGGSITVNNLPTDQLIHGWIVIDAGSQPIPVTGTFWQGTQPVSIASMPSTPVTGTFWQATQPISGTVTANAGTGTLNVSVQNATMPSTPVTGTFWQSTQPVSLASMPSTPVTGTFWQATQPVSVATMPSTPVTGNFYQTVQPVQAQITMTTAPLNSFLPRCNAVRRTSCQP